MEEQTTYHALLWKCSVRAMDMQSWLDKRGMLIQPQLAISILLSVLAPFLSQDF